MSVGDSAEEFRFAAKLMFQYRVVANGEENVMRLCEERILVLRSTTARKALALAKKRGKVAQHSYKNDSGAIVRFEFVGVMDLLHLGLECDEDEVWYDITLRKRPKERASLLIPEESQLSAIRMITSGRPRKQKNGKGRGWGGVHPIASDPKQT
ncbi:DUF4288 domain-containing protein [Dyella silvae]|uniref:DUF4288 domain-containing protein n=1 Tax=Dyella silvae TaxID=2994424 RepID=UPI002264F47D|nr:DUF4288 domain-containing protein [Dyella silvae]